VRQFHFETAAGTAPAVGDRVTLDRDESHHLLGVLRGAEGRAWQLVDGRGHRCEAKVVGRQGKLAELEILSVTRDADETRAPLLWLACAVVKGKRFEWALEKAVELGAHRVLPLQCERGVIEPGAGRRERWRGVMLAALKQSGRCVLPDLDEPLTPAEALRACATARICWGALPIETDADRAGPDGDALAEGPPPAALALFIGPEGGWTPAESAQLQQAGARALDLGPHVLRTETAAAAGLVRLQMLRAAWLRSAGA
jgi:16S rRNA (uracil1498-N3)-methyltransferase